MNALAVELLTVAKEYLGPAAPAFLSRELHALGVNANTVQGDHVLPLAERARLAAGRLMDNKRAGEFAQALAAHGGHTGRHKSSGDHGLATSAAAKLFASGRLRQAEAAYRELVAKHADVDSYSGLARTLVSLDDVEAALTVLRDGAAALARKNDRVSAIALLGVAVEIVPTDLAAHRRLAAALANQGDLIGACEEYARFIDAALSQRDTRRAWLELTYGRETLGDLPQLLAIADRVAAAQGGAMPTPPPPVRVAATPSTIVPPKSLPAPATQWTAPAAKPPAGSSRSTSSRPRRTSCWTSSAPASRTARRSACSSRWTVRSARARSHARSARSSERST